MTQFSNIYKADLLIKTLDTLIDGESKEYYQNHQTVYEEFKANEIRHILESLNTLPNDFEDYNKQAQDKGLWSEEIVADILVNVGTCWYDDENDVTEFVIDQADDYYTKCYKKPTILLEGIYYALKMDEKHDVAEKIQEILKGL